MVEGIEQESILSILDIKDIPITLTTTDGNLTGSWRYLSPKFQYKLSPCTGACPLNNNIPLIVKLIKSNKIESAVNILRKTNPFPATLGRICPHFCEAKCTRNFIDDKVIIGRIERYLGDFALNIPFSSPKKDVDIKVAVIGGGPAGLACAYFLRNHGCIVTIYEKESILGGLVTSVIPEYRLPLKVAKKEIDKMIGELHINVKLNRDISVDEIYRLKEKNDFVVLACGLQRSIVPEKFKNIEGVFDAISILKLIKHKKKISGDSFLVVGGGNAAIDSARSLIRMGKDVKIIYRRTIDIMPAYKEEIEQAMLEKIPIWEKLVITNIEKTNGKLSVELSNTEIVDEKVVIKSFHKKLTIDGVVFAIGLQRDFSIPEQKWIYKVGDFLIGASTVAQSMASGISVAKDILKQNGIMVEKKTIEPLVEPEKMEFVLVNIKEQVNVPLNIPDNINGSFDEILQDVSKEELDKHVDRCLECGTCTGCNTCWFFCPDMCIQTKELGGAYTAQIDLSHCKGCGICFSVCPRGMIEMEEG